MSPCVPSGAALFLIEIHDQDISRNSCVMVDRMEVQMHVRRGRLVLLVIFAVSISVCRANAQKRAYEKLPAEPEVQGIEGVFIYANNPDSLAAWYRNYLGIESVKRVRFIPNHSSVGVPGMTMCFREQHGRFFLRERTPRRMNER